jgi:hypothetical protein
MQSSFVIMENEQVSPLASEILPPLLRQSINEQLRQLPAYRTMLAHTEAPAQTPAYVPGAVPLNASRVMAALMQLKDTVAILLLLSDGSLILGILWGFGVPGLVLYGLRWRQVRGKGGRGVSQAVLSLLHELFWTCVFHGINSDDEYFMHYKPLAMLYGLGALLSMGQLLVAMVDATDEDDYYPDPADEYRVE